MIKYLPFLIFFGACYKENRVNSDIKAEIGTPQLIWKIENYVLAGQGNTFLTKDEVVFFHSQDRFYSLKFLDKYTGTLNYKWNDFFTNPVTGFFDKYSSSYYYDNKIVCLDDDGTYIIDAITKKTIQRNYSKYSTSSTINGYKNFYAFSKYPDVDLPNGRGRSTLVLGDLNGQEHYIYNGRDVSNDSIDINVIDQVVFKQNSNGENCVYFFYNIKGRTERYFCEYNMITKKLTKVLSSYSSSFVFYKENIIVTQSNYDSVVGTHLSDDLLSLNAQSQKVIWKKNYLSIKQNSFTLDEKTEILYLSIFVEGIGFCVNAINTQTGTLLWSTKVLNTTSKPFLMNGILYFTDSYLWALDATTGEVIWKVTPENLNQMESLDFSSSIHNVTGDGERVFVSSGQYAYCFKAAR